MQTQNRAGEQGFSTIQMTVMLLSALTLSAGLYVSSARQDFIQSFTYVERTRALMLAEAAVEESLAHLDATSDWTTLTLPDDDFLEEISVDEGTYWAEVINNPTDPGGSVDTDGLLLVRGYGRPTDSTFVTNIEVAFRLPRFDRLPQAALTVCGADVLDVFGGALSIDGFNHYLPPSPCSGAGCNSVRNSLPTDKPGIAFEDATRSMSLPASKLQGDPPQTAGDAELGGVDGVCGHARFLALNFPRLKGVEAVTSWPTSGGIPYGSISDPKLLYVPEGEVLKINGNNQGTGVLMVDGTLLQSGTFTWTGLVIVGPHARINFNGTTNVFGGTITAGGLEGNPAVAEVDFKGDVSLNWSAQAANFDGTTVPGLVVSWKEFK